MDESQFKYVSLFLNELESIRRYSSSTITAYKKDIEQFINFCKENDINHFNQISEKKLRYFLIYLNELESGKKKGLSKTSISRKLSSLRSFYEFLFINEIIERNPVKDISNPKIKRNLPETLTLDSFEKIYDNIGENEKENSHLYKTIFDLLYGCALRVSELCSIELNNIDLKNGSLRILGKGSKERIIPIGIKTIQTISDYLLVRPNTSSKYLLVNSKGNKLYSRFVYRIVNKYIKQVSDIKKKSPHILRHSAATHMLDNEADLLAVKEILGHENLSTTQIYTHVSIERLKKTYKNAHPKS